MLENLQDTRIKVGLTIQVRLVADLKASLAYYRDILGCTVDDWGHAQRDDMIFILQQAKSRDDVRPNAASQKRQDYPTEWHGPDHGWDTFVHMEWEDLEPFVEEIREKGAIISVEPFTAIHGKWEFKNVYVDDPDGYTIVFGAMREI
ncbi:Catechol 2,3-dioxygenase [Gracilibacillus ureilyticus]|uniref:Catechol 2,3-dioxygenase n=1 Tax=Gracilibacillus ureilyticus TaxID=531814 RepID=A0A1H9MSB9_9BACI|nr:VOC family protein [Gracilibacillus ureilyticus]SER26315.1 Catechol 2,3-dioxygenase [Gracilibacillus ureilyticus]